MGSDTPTEKQKAYQDGIWGREVWSHWHGTEYEGVYLSALKTNEKFGPPPLHGFRFGSE
jgi:hypothetical protein